VHEALGAIFESLSEQSLGGYISESHSGQFFNYLRCSNCGNQRGQREPFRDLHLEVRSMRSVEDALRTFIAGEDLDGVDCENCAGRHPHRKVVLLCSFCSNFDPNCYFTLCLQGLEIESLPSVLFLQLKRFDISYETFQRIKLNDAVVIPTILDATEFVKPATAGEKCELVYELVSVLMHIGSATAGHYFAYVRDLASDRWFKFNDSVVDEVDMVQLEIILGSTNVKTSGSAEAPKAATSNAYMLVYRLKSPGNQSSVDPALVPGDLQYLIRTENAELEVLRAEWEKERKFHNLTVYPLEGPAKVVRIHEDRSVLELTQACCDTFGGEFPDLLKRGLLRLRVYDTLRNVCLAPLGDDPKAALSGLPEGWNKKPLKFDIRSEDGSFEVYHKDGIQLKILKLLEGSSDIEFSDPLSVSVSASANVGQLRESISQVLKLASSSPTVKSLRIIRYSGCSADELSDDSVKLNTLGLNQGDSIHVEDSGLFPESQASSVIPSRLMTYFEGLINLATITFNDPRFVPPTNDESGAGACKASASEEENSSVVAMLKRSSGDDGSKRSVKVDLRQNLRVLKSAMSEVLCLPMEEFKIRRTAGGVELKDLEESIAAHGLEDGSSLNIKEGSPLTPGQWLFNIKYVKAHGEPSIPLGPVVLEDSMTTSEIKDILFRTFGESHHTPSPEKTRLRMASGTGIPGGVKMTTVLTDGATLGVTYGDKISDGKMLAIQPSPVGELFTPNHMLLCVRVWSPVMQILAPVQEIGVLRLSSFNEFQIQLAPLLGSTVEADDVVIAKPFAYLLKDVANMSSVKWLTLQKEQRLADAPMRVKDGDLLVFKNRKEKEQLPLSSEISLAAAPRPAPSDGPAFTIFSPSEQVEREESKRVEDKAQEQEEKERTEAIRARIGAAAIKASLGDA
jgi:hypothetical protein